MTFVRTVLGDIPASELGVCYAHEHIIIDPCYATQLEPDFLLDSVEHAVTELKLFRDAGGRAVIDAMPCACGRNILKLAAVARSSGVHLVAPTGLHLRKYYCAGHWMDRYAHDADALAELFIADIEEGVDANDYSGPSLNRTSHKAGVIKIASGQDKLTSAEVTLFRAAAKAQVATGCPILTHTEQGTAALEQVDVLLGSGADLSRVVLSHCDRVTESDYHRSILKTGVKVEYDSCFRWKAGQENHTLRLVAELIGDFPHKIMLGMDAARRKYWTSRGGAPGLAFLLTDFSEWLRGAGVTAAQCEDIFVNTPAESYSFARA
jgi:5-phospho-D-xylono-1,4-lactonase